MIGELWRGDLRLPPGCLKRPPDAALATDNMWTGRGNSFRQLTKSRDYFAAG